jgi:bacillithiol system protein YtxJ
MSGLLVVQHVEQLEQLLQLSYEKPLFLYKHSTNCGSSRNAHYSLHKFMTGSPHTAALFQFAMVRVVEEKPVSEHIANRLGVPHVSPQLLLVRNGRAIWNVSHQQINTVQLTNVANHVIANLHRKGG